MGLPAKSGVSGSLVLVIPNTMAVALWSPPLDEIGNTARGVQLSQVNGLPLVALDSLLIWVSHQGARRSLQLSPI